MITIKLPLALVGFLVLLGSSCPDRDIPKPPKQPATFKVTEEQSALFEAIKQNDLARVEALWPMHNWEHVVNEEGDTPLLYAIKHTPASKQKLGKLVGSKSKLDKRIPCFLAAKKLDLETRNEKLQTPLTPLQMTFDRQSDGDIDDIVVCLVENGASLNDKVKNDMQPLEWSLKVPDIGDPTKIGRSDLLSKLFIKRVAQDPDELLNGDLPLNWAIRNTSIANIVQELLDAGAQINRRGYGAQENWPLHTAVLTGKLSLVQQLVNNPASGASLGPQNAEKQTPLHLAYREGHTDIAAFLESKGASPYGVDLFGKTPLDYKGFSWAEWDVRTDTSPDMQELLANVATDCEDSSCAKKRYGQCIALFEKQQSGARTELDLARRKGQKKFVSEAKKIAQKISLGVHSDKVKAAAKDRAQANMGLVNGCSDFMGTCWAFCMGSGRSASSCLQDCRMPCMDRCHSNMNTEEDAINAEHRKCEEDAVGREKECNESYWTFFCSGTKDGEFSECRRSQLSGKEAALKAKDRCQATCNHH